MKLDDFTSGMILGFVISALIIFMSVVIIMKFMTFPSEIKREAVKAGAAKWVSGSNGDAVLQWNNCNIQSNVK